MTDRALQPSLTLLAWLSPAFPVGTYAYSHGLEWAVEAGDVSNAADLERWLRVVLFDGYGRTDAILLAAAWRAAHDDDRDRLSDVNDLALALAPSSELLLETTQQGRSFLDAVLASWPEPRLATLTTGFGRVAYPVALGLATACHDVPLRDAAAGHLMALAGTLVSAAIRLAPIGQTAGQAVLSRLIPALCDLAETVLACDLDDVGGPTFRADLGSFRHETQYTRLFRS